MRLAPVELTVSSALDWSWIDFLSFGISLLNRSENVYLICRDTQMKTQQKQSVYCSFKS